MEGPLLWTYAAILHVVCLLRFLARHVKIHARLSYDHAVCLSVCPSARPSVTLVDYDHILQQNVEMGMRHDRSMSRMHAKVDPDQCIL